jgi:hypothetical protein
VTETFERPAAYRVAAAAVALVFIASVAAAITYEGGGIPAGGGRLSTTGAVIVQHRDGTRTTVRGSTALRAGDVVESVEGGMTIQLSDGSTLEGRVRRGDAAATKLKVSVPLELLAGELLLESRRGTTVDAAGNQVRLDDGVARVARGLAVTAATYRGDTALDSAGQERSVPALRELDVSVLGRPPTTAKPISVDAADPWDLRYLGPAIDLSRKLDSISRTFTGSTAAANAGQTPGFYQLMLPALSTESTFTSSLFASRVGKPQGDTLVGAAIALLGTNGTFADRWTKVFDFAGAGAGWGLVAMDQGVAGDPLLKAIESALNQTSLQIAQPVVPAGTPAATVPTTPVPAAPTTNTTAPPGTQPGGTTPTGPTTPAPTLPVPPPTLPPPPPTGVPLVDGLVNTVGQLLGGLLGR